jgi:hypothetical protein
VTYRERREAKAERLREWADKRELRADAARERADRLSGMIPMGQPILVGHHSEKRHRKDLDRIQGGTIAAIENGRKAESFRSRADNIEVAAGRAIYGDDPDAIERLTERIAALEAERDTVKAANAAYRKEHKQELAGLTAYGRDMALPYRGYVLTNLSGNISRQRKRLAELTRSLSAERFGWDYWGNESLGTAELA